MKRVGVISLLAMLLAAGSWLFYTCAVNPNVNFLTPGPGAWIVYPMPRQAIPLKGQPMTTVFRRVFVRPANSAAATLSWRCCRAGQLRLNGVKVGAADSADWKKTSRLELADNLLPGTNQLEVRVSCSNGLPALSLELSSDGFLLVSDESWECSLMGAVWQPARRASQPLEPTPGNWLYRTEEMQGALRQCWPMMCIFALLAVALRRFGRLLPDRFRSFGLVLAAQAWTILVMHNIPLMPALSGFDASAHLAYMDFIQKHKALPSASQGWEFFQAPLYYILGAVVLGVLHLGALQPEARQVLGLLNFGLVAVELALILASLRLLFPGRRSLQLVGLLLAAFLPAQVYQLQFPSNETLGAVIATGAFYLVLTILRQPRPSLGRYAALGVVLGAALLSKASAVMILAAILLTLVAQAWTERPSPRVFLGRAGLCLGLSLLVGGWPYWKLWRQFGNPLTGNWDPAVGAAWWQQPGYHTPAYYLSFGQSLVRPFFSGFHSFWDGLYSTWWGDGLFGGTSRLYSRVPWNYNLMTVGFVLALIPSALVLTGLRRALVEAVRRRGLDWLLLASAALFFGFAIFAMSLKLPFYSESRAMYALPLVLPFCAFGALGWDFWQERCSWARPILFVWLGVWLLTVYSSFWILPGTVPMRLSIAGGFYDVPGQDAGTAFQQVLALEPNNAQALVALADLDEKGGHLDRGVARLEAAAQATTNEMIEATLALLLGEQGHVPEALTWAKRACDLSQDFPTGLVLLCSLSLRAGQNEQAVWAGTRALRLTPQNEDVHFNVGLALVRLKRFEEAAAQLSDAAEEAPRNANAHFWLGIALWNVPGRKAEARDQVAAAIRLAPQHAEWKPTLDEMQRGL
jgi:Flp pilus assembly protein TadD